MKTDEQRWDVLGAPLGSVGLVAHEPVWADLFKEESARIQKGCQPYVIETEHIGSTAIPNLSAEPILDIMPGIESLDHAREVIPLMKDLGYACHGEQGIPGRRFFSRKIEGQVVAHAHLFVVGTDAWNQHIAFRDLLLAEGNVVSSYEQCKQALAQSHQSDRKSYAAGKVEFFRSVEIETF